MELKINPHWERAKKIIPGGSQLLSKRSERFLPNYWPAFFKKAKGISITDLEDNTYQDFSIMGIGSCILGYADDDVNNAVKSAIDDSSMGTLNSLEDVELAELLIELHPWAQKVRYARTGGEACTVAVRIARAFTGKDTVAFCGYHGWHDWYLAGNLADSANLDGHLLAGLEPAGVPKGLKGTAIPFHFNKIEELEKIVTTSDIGVIIMEPIRHQEPKDNFLQKVRDIADRIGAVLIFDEVSSGFRLTNGGAHLQYGVNPDIAVFGKAMSNGFPMSAIIGKSDVMDFAQRSFISSTYWTDRIGPTAAIATIKKIVSQNVTVHINAMGQLIGEGWKRLAEKHGLDVEIIGPNALITLSFNYPNDKEIKTLFIQEMLKRGYLASLGVYVCFGHNETNIKEYLTVVDEVFGMLKKAITDNTVSQLLEGPVAQDGFQRLT